MFAVIRTGGKQYYVQSGSELNIERIKVSVGDIIEISDVLLCSQESETNIGKPVLENVKVKAEVLSHIRGPKSIAFKKIRRHGKQWKKGHRQELTRIRINEIQLAA